MNRNTQALKQLSITLAALTYCGAVVYGDIMFISVMHAAFPSGLLGTLAIAGAVMTAVSAITLPIALHYWFSPGLQFMWGVIFWLVDIAALSLNAILAYALASGSSDPWLLQWQSISPATPLLAVVGWGLAFLLDSAHRLRHAQAELEADLIDIHTNQLRQAAKGDSVAEAIATGARLSAAETASRLTGQSVTAQNILLPKSAASVSPEVVQLMSQYGLSAQQAHDLLTAESETASPLLHGSNGHGPKG